MTKASLWSYDKCRAVVASTNGEYAFNCPLDRQFFDFTGIDAEAFKALVATGSSDDEIVAWVKGKTTHLSPEQIAVWCHDARMRTPASLDEKAFLESYRQKFSPHACYVSTWFKMLDAEENRL